MSGITGSELCSLITNVRKPPTNFNFTQTEHSCTIILFEEIQWFCYSPEDGAYCLPCVLFGHKNSENFYKKYIEHGQHL